MKEVLPKNKQGIFKRNRNLKKLLKLLTIMKLKMVQFKSISMIGRQRPFHRRVRRFGLMIVKK